MAWCSDAEGAGILRLFLMSNASRSFRGPQGTLFGKRNASCRCISIVTNSYMMSLLPNSTVHMVRFERNIGLSAAHFRPDHDGVRGDWSGLQQHARRLYKRISTRPRRRATVNERNEFGVPRKLSKFDSSDTFDLTLGADYFPNVTSQAGALDAALRYSSPGQPAQDCWVGVQGQSGPGSLRPGIKPGPDNKQ